MNSICELEIAMKKAMVAQAFTEASAYAAAILAQHPTHQFALEVSAEASAELEVSEAAARRSSSTPVSRPAQAPVSSMRAAASRSSTPALPQTAMAASDPRPDALTDFDGGWDESPRPAGTVSTFARIDSPFGDDEEAAQAARRQYMQDALNHDVVGPRVTAPAPAIGVTAGADEGQEVTLRPTALPAVEAWPRKLDGHALDRVSASLPAYAVDISALNAADLDPQSDRGTSATSPVGLATEQHADAREMYALFIASDFAAAQMLASAILERAPDHGIALAVLAECEAAASGRPTLPPVISRGLGKVGR